MRVILFGRDQEKIRSAVEKAGFEVVEDKPDFVVSFGGDGTLMRSEGKYPGVPKIVLKNSGICKKCSAFSNEEVLKKVSKGEYRTESLTKLEARAKGKTLKGFNDITVHNRDPRHGIRYSVLVNGKEIGKEIIGDGIVVATPFGSTAYYRSITDSFFEVGIGLAFNNSTEQSDHMVLNEDSVIEISFTRGPAVVYADNHEEFITLEAGESVKIKKSEEIATILVPE